MKLRHRSALAFLHLSDRILSGHLIGRGGRIDRETLKYQYIEDGHGGGVGGGGGGGGHGKKRARRKRMRNNGGDGRADVGMKNNHSIDSN